MDNIEALYYKKKLNKYIEKCLDLDISFPEIFESILTEEEEYAEFSDFTRSRIGQIWLKKGFGKTYANWQNET